MTQDGGLAARRFGEARVEAGVAYKTLRLAYPPCLRTHHNILNSNV